MRALRGRIAGLLETPDHFGIIHKHFDMIHVGRTVLTGIRVPRKLLPMLANARQRKQTTVYINSQRIVGIEVDGRTYYSCNSLFCKLATVFFIAVILLALFAYPSAVAWPPRLLVVAPYLCLLGHTWWTYSAFKVLRNAPGATSV